MKYKKLSKLLSFLFVFAFSGVYLYGQQVLSPKQIKDPAYAQLDFMNRLNEWNIRQMGFMIVGGAYRNSGKKLTQAEINRIVENAKKLKRYNSTPTVTHFKDNGRNVVTEMVAKEAEFRDVDQMMAASLMNRSITYYLTTSMQDQFEANDLTWAMVYFLDLSYLIYHDSSRPDKSTTNLKGVSPQISFKIYQQIHKTLAEDPAIKKMTDLQKQIAAENLVIMAGSTIFPYVALIDPTSYTNLANGMYGRAVTPQEKEAKIDAIKRQAGQNMEKIFGVPAGKIKIDKNGVSFD